MQPRVPCPAVTHKPVAEPACASFRMRTRCAGLPANQQQQQQFDLRLRHAYRQMVSQLQQRHSLELQHLEAARQAQVAAQVRDALHANRLERCVLSMPCTSALSLLRCAHAVCMHAPAVLPASLPIAGKGGQRRGSVGAFVHLLGVTIMLVVTSSSFV